MRTVLTPKTALVAALAAASCLTVHAQTPSGNRGNQVLIHHVPQQLNPAYAGSTGKGRVAFNAHNLAGIATGFWKKGDIAQNWAIDRTFEAEMADKDREELYKGWQKAVKRSMGWLKDE